MKRSNVRWRRLRYLSHLQRTDTNIWSRRVNYVIHRSLPRGRPQLRWSDDITKKLKDLIIRKELADKRVEWQRAIMPKKIHCKEYDPSEVDKHYKRWVR